MTQWQKETSLAMLAAVEGARIATDRPADLHVHKKESERDIVTSVDLMIEERIRFVLRESEYIVIGEEQMANCHYPLPEPNVAWVVDPIDGTANYANGLGYYAISVGLCRGAEFVLGAVCMPATTELFSTFGKGRALLNGRNLAHEHRAPAASLVAASFAGSSQDAERRSREYELFGMINDRTRGCLRLGSAASNICLVAAGRLQAAYGMNAKLWDVAASIAIATAAGCKVLVSVSGGSGHLDYIVGSRETVDLIHELCKTFRFMDGAREA